jgi:hypothetical protein
MQARHEGQVCTTSWHEDAQNGIKQQPKTPPKMQIRSEMSQVPAPASY